MKTEILKQLQDTRLRFNEVSKRTLEKSENGKEKVHSVKVAHLLNELLAAGFVKREYIARESWYELTDEGKRLSQKEKAMTEVKSSSTRFWNLPSKCVESSDGKADASVYCAPIDQFTQKQISKIIQKYPDIKIIGHGKEPSKSE